MMKLSSADYQRLCSKYEQDVTKILARAKATLVGQSCSLTEKACAPKLKRGRVHYAEITDVMFAGNGELWCLAMVYRQERNHTADFLNSAPWTRTYRPLNHLNIFWHSTLGLERNHAADLEIMDQRPDWKKT